MGDKQPKEMDLLQVAADRQAIMQLFAQMSEAWNKGDAESFAACFTDDADYVTFNGSHLKGRREIADVHARLWSGVLRGSLLLGSSQELRFAAPDVALVHAVGAVQLRWQKRPPTRRLSINTNVVLKVNGQWRIAAFHNCRMQQPGWLQRLLVKS